MNVKENRICRLCLKVAKKEFKIINKLLRQILDVLLLQLDLELTRDPIICQKCMEITKYFLNFKYTCIDTEQIILSCSIGGKKAKHCIKVIYHETEHVTVNEDLDICRFCMNQSKGHSFLSLNTINRTTLAKLSKHMPEIDFDNIENSMVCTTCKENLEGYLKFLLKCLDIERKIKAYAEEIDSKGQIKLDNNVRHSLFKYSLLEHPDNSHEISVIKDQLNKLEDSEYAYNDTCHGLIKYEVSDDNKVKESDMAYITRRKHHLAETKQKDKVGRRTLSKKDSPDDHSYASVHKNPYDIKMFKCSLCAYRGKQRCHLQTHMLVHKDASEIRMYMCSLCTYKAKQKSNLKQHMLVHKDLSEIKMYKCSFCPHEFKRKHSLKMHMLIHKDISEIKMYKCSLCAHETKYKKNLTKHMLVHKDASEVKMYKCSLCAYKVKRKENLKRHIILIHKDISEVTTYKCSSCTHESKQKGDLKRHMLVHKDASEIKMNKCPLCAYETKQKGSLRMHMLVHKDVTYKNTLKDHIVILKDNLGMKMYMCLLCDHKARYKNNLKRHIMSIHKDNNV